MRGFPVNAHLFLLKLHSFTHTRSFRNTIRASQGLFSLPGIDDLLASNQRRSLERRVGPGSHKKTKKNKMGQSDRIIPDQRSLKVSKKGVLPINASVYSMFATTMLTKSNRAFR